MSEWHVDPVRITSRWSDELLMLMVDRWIERKRREAEAIKSGGKSSDTNWLSPEEFAELGRNG